MSDNIKQDIFDIVATIRHQPLAAGQEAMPFKDIDIDSLEVANVFLMVEEKFGIKISDADAESLRTVTDLIQFVEARTGR